MLTARAWSRKSPAAIVVVGRGMVSSKKSAERAMVREVGEATEGGGDE